MNLTQQQLETALDAVDYPDDCKRIRDLARARLGLLLTLGQAERVWIWHSECHAAGWHSLGDDDEIERAILSFVTSRVSVRGDQEISKLLREIFTDDIAANRWLRTPARALGGEIPAELMKTPAGTARVRQAILSLTHGNPI